MTSIFKDYGCNITNPNYNKFYQYSLKIKVIFISHCNKAICCDKFFKIDFGAPKFQCLITAVEIVKIQMETSFLDLNVLKKQNQLQNK